jgi:Ser/Thr protein kinase RdoA (MazF antagonist)
MRRLAECALPLYGIEPYSLQLLQHAYNTTFAVTGSSHGRYVLHILRPVGDVRSESQREARVRSELWWLDRVGKNLDLAAPIVMRTLEGEKVVRVAVEGVTPPRLCTLFGWIDGRHIRHRLTVEHLAAVGRLTARLHVHSTGLQVPGWFDRPIVDRADLETEEEVARLFTDGVSAEAAAVLRAVFTRTRQAQHILGSAPETFGVMHADIHQNNYLFHGHDVRLIDFGDCGWGHYLYDLAVTLSEIDDLPHRTQLRTALLAGYREIRTLSPAHEALIDTFFLLRRVQDVTWVLQARDDPSYRARAAHIGERVAELEQRLGAGT